MGEIFVLFGCYPKEMAGKQEEIHNILVALLSGDEKEIYNVLYKKKEIDDKTPKLRTEDEKKKLKSLSNKMRKFPKDLIDGIQKKFPFLQRTPKTSGSRHYRPAPSSAYGIHLYPYPYPYPHPYPYPCPYPY